MCVILERRGRRIIHVEEKVSFSNNMVKLEQAIYHFYNAGAARLDTGRIIRTPCH